LNDNWHSQIRRSAADSNDSRPLDNDGTQFFRRILVVHKDNFHGSPFEGGMSDEGFPADPKARWAILKEREENIRSSLARHEGLLRTLEEQQAAMPVDEFRTNFSVLESDINGRKEVLRKILVAMKHEQHMANHPAAPWP